METPYQRIYGNGITQGDQEETNIPKLPSPNPPFGDSQGMVSSSSTHSQELLDMETIA
jgi:hypothetical protein